MVMMRKDGEGARKLHAHGVYLRAPEPRDWQDWSDLREESRAFLTPWEPAWGADELSRSAYRFRLRRYAEDARDDRAYAFFAFRDEDGALVGGLTMSNVRRGVAQTASLGYWAGERFANQGFISAAVAIIVTHAFEELGLHRVEAACQPDNGASQRVLAKNGFAQEGRARAYLKINGVWRDHILYARVKDGE